jgi:hypothetical protein
VLVFHISLAHQLVKFIGSLLASLYIKLILNDVPCSIAKSYLLAAIVMPYKIVVGTMFYTPKKKGQPVKASLLLFLIK